MTRPWDEASERSETDGFAKRLYAATADADRAVVEQVAKLAEQRGVPRAQIALAWVLQKKPISAPIVGATKTHHLDDAIGALSLKLSPEEVAMLEEPYVAHPVSAFT